MSTEKPNGTTETQIPVGSSEIVSRCDEIETRMKAADKQWGLLITPICCNRAEWELCAHLRSDLIWLLANLRTANAQAQARRATDK